MGFEPTQLLILNQATLPVCPLRHLKSWDYTFCAKSLLPYCLGANPFIRNLSPYLSIQIWYLATPLFLKSSISLIIVKILDYHSTLNILLLYIPAKGLGANFNQTLSVLRTSWILHSLSSVELGDFLFTIVRVFAFYHFFMTDSTRVERATSCLRYKCSTNWANFPKLFLSLQGALTVVS